ncbi:MAG TPA: cell division protein ZapA, partial [bacterium]
MTEKKSVTVTIYGNEYTLKGEADPNYITELAKFVDGRMTEIGKKSSAPAAKVAILASMNIADELHRLEKAKADNLKLIETLEKNLLEMKKSSDGSLKHTMEVKEQLDKLKMEAAENRKKAEEAENQLRDIKKNLETSSKTSGEASAELEKCRKDLEAASQKAKDFDRVEKELQSLKPQVEKLQATASTEKKKSEESQLDLTSMKSENHHL